jgi:hypothetical protein
MIKIPHSAFNNNSQIDQYKFNKENSLIKGIPDSLTYMDIVERRNKNP